MRLNTKRMGSIICLALLLVSLAAPASFASGLKMTSSFPEDGNSSLERTNLMVKFFFNEDVTSDAAKTANANKFSVRSEKGDVSPEFQVIYDPADPQKICLIMKKDLAVHTNYIVTVSKDLVSSTGDTLDKDITIHFGTRNEKRDNAIYMGLMFVLVMAMVFFTQMEQKKKAEKETEQKPEKVNPYKVAKEKGISVEKAVSQAEKQKEKNDKKKPAPPKQAPQQQEQKKEPEKKARPVKHVATKRVAKLTFEQKKQKQETQKKEQQQKRKAQQNKKKKR